MQSIINKQSSDRWKWTMLFTTTDKINMESMSFKTCTMYFPYKQSLHAMAKCHNEVTILYSLDNLSEWIAVRNDHWNSDLYCFK